MAALKNIWNVAIGLTLMTMLTACGEKRFDSLDMASDRGGTGVIENPGPEVEEPPITPEEPGDQVIGDQCVLIYDVWGINSPSNLNNTPFTSAADCRQIAAASVLMNFGAADAVSYSLYHLTDAEVRALLTQVTGVTDVTAETFMNVNASEFKQALLASGKTAFYHLAGWGDDIF